VRVNVRDLALGYPLARDALHQTLFTGGESTPPSGHRPQSIAVRCQGSVGTARGRSRNLPAGGHGICPRAAISGVGQRASSHVRHRAAT
jgi:hypothetical protein